MPSPSLPNEYPIELSTIDLSPYAKGNSGIPYLTTYDSGRAGPHVMISAVVHGNEICGPLALDWLAQNEVRPLIGKLSLLFANVAAYKAFDPNDPFTSRYVDQDFNRVWSPELLDSKATSTELDRARQVRPALESVDFLLDIHSMQTPSPALGLSGPHPKGREFAQQIGVPHLIVADKGHAEGTRMRDYGAFADPVSPKNAMLIECGQHWEVSAADLALESCLRLLRSMALVEPDFGGDLARDKPSAQKLIEITHAITIQSERFTFAKTFRGGEIIEKQGTLIGHDGEMPITSPYDHCILIMPTKRTYKGQTAVRIGRFL